MLPLMSKIDADRHRHIFARKPHDFLLDAVLEHAEVLLLEPGDQTPERIGHRHVDERHLRLGSDRLALLDS